MENTSCKSCNGKIPMASELDPSLARGETPSPLPSVAQALMPTNLTFDPKNSGVAIATYAPTRSAQPIRRPEIMLPRDEALLIETQPAPRSPIEPRVSISDDFNEKVTPPPRTSNRGQSPTLGMATGSLPIAQRYTLSGITTLANAEVFGIQAQDKPVKVKGEQDKEEKNDEDKSALPIESDPPELIKEEEKKKREEEIDRRATEIREAETRPKDKDGKEIPESEEEKADRINRIKAGIRFARADPGMGRGSDPDYHEAIKKAEMEYDGKFRYDFNTFETSCKERGVELLNFKLTVYYCDETEQSASVLLEKVKAILMRCCILMEIDS